MEKDEAQSLFKGADELYKAGDYDGALKLLDQLDREFPNDRRIMYPRAMCLAETGRTAEAVALCDALVEKHGYSQAAQLRQRLEPQPSNARTTPMPDFDDASAQQLEDMDIEGGPTAFTEAQPSNAQATPMPDLNDDVTAQQLENMDIEGGHSAFTKAPPVQTGSGGSRMGLIVGVAVVLLLVAAGAGGGYYFYTQQKDNEESIQTPAQAAPPPQAPTTASSVPEIDLSGPPELIQLERSQSQNGVTVNASVEYGVWTDCGSYDCFVEKFQACEPAAIRMQTMGTFIVEYRVLGDENGVCQLEMTAVEMPNVFASWRDKSMTCPCDNTRDFIDVTEEMSIEGIMKRTLKCEGSLFEAMQETASQYQQ